MGEVVFQVIDTLAIGGAERMAVDVSNGLAHRDWGVHLFATRGLGPLASEVDTRIPVHDLARRSRWDLDGLRRFRRAVAHERAAVVHAHGWSSLRFASAALLGLRRPPPLVFHDHRPPGLPPLGRSYRMTAWAFVRAHIAVDRALLTPPLRTRRRSVQQVVPNGVPLDRIAVKPDHAITGRPRLVALANLRPQKDHPVLFAAIRRLADRGIETDVDLIGADSDREYRRACTDRLAELGLTDRVHLLGSRSDVADRLATYDIGVLSSHTESGPIALIEYLAAGLPFVVTDVGEIPAALPAELRRWVVPPGDECSLAATLEEAIHLPADERRHVGEAGVAFAHDHLSIDRTVDSVERVYAQLTVR